MTEFCCPKCRWRSEARFGIDRLARMIKHMRGKHGWTGWPRQEPICQRLLTAWKLRGKEEVPDGDTT